MKCSACLTLLLLVPVAGAAQHSRCSSVTVADRGKAPDAVFVVSLLGNVLARPASAVTEEDAILVRVLTTDTMAPQLSVHRTSSARTVGNLRVIGLPEELSPMALGAVRTAATAPSCFLDVVLADFEPGLGEAEIRLVTRDGAEVKRVSLGTFDFSVEPVYVGMASLGPVVTDLQDPKFELATNSAGETYIAAAESGEDRILYALIYTPFIGGKRVADPALTSEPRSWLRRINPMFGIVLSDVSRNALAGVSLDLPFGLVAHGGWHMGRTSEIDPESGLAPGSAFPADGIIPVVRKWNTDRFLGLTLDTRVALRLLGLAGKTSVP